MPQEKDYAITLLVDLSGSMTKYNKIGETFKAIVVLAEVLNRLSIKTEIIGFNSEIYEYQSYGQDMSNEVRNEMGKILREPYSSNGEWNDDGWALQEASTRLARQKASEKFLIVLSDGYPFPSLAHRGQQYDLKAVIEKILKNTDQKLIGLGVGRDTANVGEFYPNSIDSIMVTELPDRLANVIREVISKPGTF
jgi:cobalamin biosynthesis protein CobT